MSDSTPSLSCGVCEAQLPPYPGRGRPRSRCDRCRAASVSALNKAWRAANPARVERYNRDRRVEYAVRRDVARARARLAYAQRTGVAVARARFSLARAIERECLEAARARWA